MWFRKNKFYHYTYSNLHNMNDRMLYSKFIVHRENQLNEMEVQRVLYVFLCNFLNFNIGFLAAFICLVLFLCWAFLLQLFLHFLSFPFLYTLSCIIIRVSVSGFIFLTFRFNGHSWNEHVVHEGWTFHSFQKFLLKYTYSISLFISRVVVLKRPFDIEYLSIIFDFHLNNF